jgi:hypothetical protein
MACDYIAVEVTTLLIPALIRLYLLSWAGYLFLQNAKIVLDIGPPYTYIIE